MEMLKLLIAEGAAVAVQAMADAGLLLLIFGGVTYTGAFAAMIAVERALGLPPNAVRRLAALTVAVTEDAKRVAARLRLSNAETKALTRWAIAGGGSPARTTRGTATALSARRGSLPRPADAGMGAGRRRQWRRALARPRDFAAALERAEISAEGGRFHLRGIAEGPALGHVLTLAEDASLAADFPLESSALAAIADQTAARFTRDHRL